MIVRRIFLLFLLILLPICDTFTVKVLPDGLSLIRQQLKITYILSTTEFVKPKVRLLFGPNSVEHFALPL